MLLIGMAVTYAAVAFLFEAPLPGMLEVMQVAVGTAAILLAMPLAVYYEYRE